MGIDQPEVTDQNQRIGRRKMPGEDYENDSAMTDVRDLTGILKGKIKYDREFLISIGQKKGINEFKVAERGFPSLAQEKNIGNPIKRHETPKDKNAKLIMLVMNKEVQLYKAQNPWKPNVLKRGPVSEHTDEEVVAIESIVRKTRGILNKLTPANFDQLVSKFVELPFKDNDERISQVVGLIFKKAINEPFYSAAYARILWTICKTSQDTSRKFRKQVLDQCQKEFQRSSADEAEVKQREHRLQKATNNQSKLEQLKLDLIEKKFMNRMRSLGNVGFIGELFKLQMLTPKIMMESVQLLLQAPDEEKVESLCKLLTVIGQTLDLQLMLLEGRRQQGVRSKFVPEKKWMERIFSELRKLTENEIFSRRVRFAVLNIVELQENCWLPRRDINAPTTIQDVKNDPIGVPQEKTPRTQISQASEFQTGVKMVKSTGSQFSVCDPPSGTTTGIAFGWQYGLPSSSRMIPVSTLMPNLPPRLRNRFQNLAVDVSGSSNKGMSSSSQDSGGNRDHFPGMSAPHVGPSSKHCLPSVTLPVENARPVSLNDKPEFTADTTESVKNIFLEYFVINKMVDDTLGRIKNRFPGQNMDDFINEISRQVVKMSKEAGQKCAGGLVRLVIKNGEMSKDRVIKLMTQGVVAELPDILIHSPMATSYLARFLVEVFSDENSLDWLVQIGDKLIQNECDKGAAWKELAINYLTLLKLHSNEENVWISYAKTKRRNLIPIHEVAWLQ